ncbi:MAG: hypothetical protein U0228_03515 [Myxococcaceae bacterium]
MSVLEGVAAGLKQASGSLSSDALRPDRTRVGWDLEQVNALEARFRASVLEPLPAALGELSEDEHRRFKDIVARVCGSIAAVLGAARRDDAARALLAAGATTAASVGVRVRLEDGQRNLDWHVALADAEWLSRAGETRAARHKLEEIAKKAPAGPLRDEATAAIAENEVLEPIGSAPSLYTLNGVGAKLYGKSAQRADGSYLAAYCFCVLFIPVIPIRAYRVADASNGGWYFLGKAPLPSFWRWYRRIVLALIIGAVGFSWADDKMSSPSWKAREAVEAGLALEKKGQTAEALATLDGALESFKDTAPEELGPALEAWVRLKLADLPTPLPMTRADTGRQLARRLAALGQADWVAKGAEPLVTRLRESARAWGSATPEALEASVSVLDAARPLTVGAVADGLRDDVNALHRNAAKAVADRWPLAALDHLLATTTSDVAANEDADHLMESLADQGELLVENEELFEAWARRTSKQDLAKSIRASVSSAKALPQVTETGVEALRKLSRARPTDQAVGVSLALALRDRGDGKGALQVLRALGPDGHLVDDALLLESMLLLESEPARGREILEAIVERGVPRLRSARERFDARATQVEQGLLDAARRNQLPLSLQQQLQTASEEQQRQLFGEWMRTEVGKDPALQQLRGEYVRASRVAMPAVRLGTLELREAAQASGENRARLLSRAERHFVGVQAESEGRPEFQLGYGQVLHRLGRPEEGDKLINAAIASGPAALKLQAAEGYRELGLASRSKELFTQVWNQSGQPEKDAAARSLSVLAHDLEEIELWLQRVEMKSPDTIIRLAQAKSHRLALEGKDAEADAELAKVVAFFEKDAATSSVSANNAAIAWLDRYDLTGDVASLDAALKALRLSHRLGAENTVVLGNFADVVQLRAMLHVLEPQIHLRGLALGSNQAWTVLRALAAGPDAAQFAPRLAEEPLLREVADLSAMEDALTPASPDALIRRYRWASLTDDVPAYQKLLAQASERKFDFSVALETLARIKDGKGMDLRQKGLTSSRQRLKAAAADPHPATRAVALGLRCDLGQSLAVETGDVAIAREAKGECDASRAAWPTLDFDPREAALTVALLEVSKPDQREPFVKLLRLDEGVAAWSAVLADPALGTAFKTHPAFQDALAWSRARAHPDLLDWVIGGGAGDRELQARARTELTTEAAKLEDQLTHALYPPNLRPERDALLKRAMGP